MTPTQEIQQRLRHYLLGQLADSARDDVEQNILVNEELFAELLIVEDELADEYVDGRLSQADRANFESHFLATPERQQNLRFARALNRYVTTHSDRREPVPGFWNSWPLRAAAAVAVVAIIAGSWWLHVHQSSPKTFVPLTLTIGTVTRSEGPLVPKVTLPLNADALKISLRLPEPSAAAVRYRVELLSENGETRPLDIAGQDAQSLTVVVPAEQLRRARYVLEVFAIKVDGTEQRIKGSYQFAVE
jgi:hypothetical protein